MGMSIERLCRGHQVLTVEALLALADPEVRQQVKNLCARAHERGDLVAVYRNDCLDSQQVGRRIFMTAGSEASQIPVEDEGIPVRCPVDGRDWSTGWKFGLEAVCPPEEVS